MVTNEQQQLVYFLCEVDMCSELDVTTTNRRLVPWTHLTGLCGGSWNGLEDMTEGPTVHDDAIGQDVHSDCSQGTHCTKFPIDVP